MRRALIVGGSGAVGTLFVGALEPECDVTVADLQPPRGDHAWLEGSATDSDVVAAATRHDIIVLCLPEAVAMDVARALGPDLAGHQLMVDTLSVKTPFLQVVAEAVPEAGVLSLNPMFAPDLGLDGRSVATIRVRDNELSDWFVDLLIGRGADLVPVEPEEHDRLTAALQVAGHAAVMAFGVTLHRLGYRADRAAALWTPPHRVLLALLARMGNLDPEVYRDIQASNPEAAPTRAHLATAVEALQAVGKDPQAFAEYLDEALRPLGSMRSELADLAAVLFRVEAQGTDR